MKIILASASPRRRELMKLITDNFSVVSNNVSEVLPDSIKAQDAAIFLAGIKAAAANSSKSLNKIVISCDTTVLCNNLILGKPKNKAQCIEYLKMLSGHTHCVITGCVLLCGNFHREFSVCTEVTFRNLTDYEIDVYSESDEPYDKAGGYAIQGKGALWVEKINGDFFNVVGLPVSRLNIELKTFYKSINKEIFMKKTALMSADILIPRKEIDMEKWAVVACDQYTSEPEYWENVSAIVGERPSSLNLILPEIFLENDDVSYRINEIHNSMKKYLNDKIFDEYKNAMIYVRRIQSNGILREGIIGRIDLEKYDFSKGSTSEVRATESTVIERIPPRIKVRQGAPLELPHIMILIDDSENTVIKPLAEKINNLTKLYDTNLMADGGQISGYLIDDELQNSVNEALCNLADPDAFNKKYSLNNTPVLLYAMGDGNHSLATAKEFYEQLKAANPNEDLSNHPARYALAEIVNLHSPALEFEAIHRLIFDVDCEKFIADMTNDLELSDTTGEQFFSYVYNGCNQKVFINKTSSNLAVGSVQNFLDSYIKNNGGKIDYIHGIETVKSLAQKHNGIAIILPNMDKSQLFPTVIKDGALPRKTFSMGHAADKRYYIEARNII